MMDRVLDRVCVWVHSSKLYPQNQDPGDPCTSSCVRSSNILMEFPFDLLCVGVQDCEVFVCKISFFLRN